MKKTDKGDWAHVVCAFWIPDCEFRDADAVEVITGTHSINRDRYNLRCVVCDASKEFGPCIQCFEPRCRIAFHPMCAMKSKSIQVCVSFRSFNQTNKSISCFFCSVFSRKECLVRRGRYFAIATTMHWKSTLTLLLSCSWTLLKLTTLQMAPLLQG